MSAKDLKQLLEHVDDTRELVLHPVEEEVGGDGWRAEELFIVWSAARAEANEAYREWCERPGRGAYVVYLAAEDRADAAQVALAAERSA